MAKVRKGTASQTTGVNERDLVAFERFSKIVDGPMTVLAIVWLPLIVVPLIVHLGPAVSGVFSAIDYALWALFVVEYLVKLYLYPRRLVFVRSHLLDLLIVAVPFVRPLMLLRVLATFRVGALAVDGLGRAKKLLTQHNLHYVVLAATIIVFAGAATELGFERHAPGANIRNYGDALWWAVSTVSTVGYGDVYPTTAGGRGVAIVLMLVGLGLLGTVTANLASFLVARNNDSEKQTLQQRLGHMEEMLEILTNQISNAAVSDRDEASHRRQRLDEIAGGPTSDGALSEALAGGRPQSLDLGVIQPRLTSVTDQNAL